MLHANRRLRIVMVVLTAVAVLAPVAAFAAGGTFTDDDTSIFEGDIEWMAANGITTGCNPPTNDNYCPDDAVTRGQMAAFMKRLATKQVVAAADSVLLDGKPASYYESIVWATDVPAAILPGTLVTGGSTWAEMTVTAPNDGYLLINSSASIYDPDTDSQSLWWIQVDNTTCNAIPDNTASVGFAYASVYSDFRRQSASITGGAAVTAGSHTLTLCGTATTSAGTQVYAPSLTALFTTAGTVPTP